MTTVSSLTAAEKADLYSQVGDAMYADGFNYDAHVSANTEDGVFVKPTYTPPESTDRTIDNTGSIDKTLPKVTTGVKPSTIVGLSQEEREELYRQVGDAMYSPGFNYSAHIEGNKVNGVFIAPVYIPPDTSELLALPAVGSDVFKALLAETGGAAANKDFNYAAHIAAKLSKTRLDLSYDDVIRLIKETGRSDVGNVDLEAHRLATGSTVGLGNGFANADAAKIASDAISRAPILQMPTIGTDEYQALLEETGGASASEGFNYAAHVAAITSQNVLKSLSYSEVMTLIAETGRTDFKDFDITRHQAEKAAIAPMLDRVIANPKNISRELPKAGTVEYQRLLEETGRNSLKDFDYEAHLTALHEANLAISTLIATDGDDEVIATTNGNKGIFALGLGNDRIKATAKADVIIGGQGDDVLDGGEGIDKAIFSGTSSDYSITINQDGPVAVVDSVKSRDGADSLLQVERLNFADTSLAFDIAGNAGAGYRIYKAAFGREPDHAGLGYWIDKLDEGADLAADVASGFLVSAEFEALYGSNTTDEAFVENLYENVLKRAPDEGGSRYWQDLLNAGEQRANILRNFSESNENIDQVADLVGQGITYIEYLG